VIPNFDWDLDKSRENVRKHGVTFEEAATVFGDDDAIIHDDDEHSDAEDRFIITGMSARERILLTVYTIREKDVIRIISSRRASRQEKAEYEKKVHF
jgi:uncharacterized DUF497 family protein